MIDFTLSEEQKLLIEMTRSFVEKEMVPNEDELERTNQLSPQLASSLKEKSMDLAIHIASMPTKGLGLTKRLLKLLF